MKTLTSKSKRNINSRESRQDRLDHELIEKSLKRFKITYESESATRAEALKDLEFSIGTGQWDGAIKAQRDIEGRPCLTVNRIPTFLRQYTGEQRQHRPGMIVDPVGSKSDPETAEICQGTLRHIEQVSFADVVYDTTYDMMLRIGVAYSRVNTEYIGERSFDQEPRIELIENPFAVYMSPIRKPDGTDPLWCHVVEDMGKEEYKEEFPDSKLTKINFASDLGNPEPTWVTKNGARIAEYWWLELVRKTLFQLADGSTVFSDEFHGDKAEVVNDRDVVTRKVCCVKHNAVEILKRYEWLGKYIPINELSGVRLNVNGKIYRAGMVRDAQDPQRIYNFEVTGMAEMIALMPKNPVYVPEGALGNHEEEWRQANRKAYPFLYYKPFDEGGKALPAPNRLNAEAPIEAISKMVQQSDYDLKSVIGIYGPGLGEQGPAQESGFAILNRQEQSETGSVNWSDNLNRAICWQGKILLDLFPKLITAPRIQRIIKPDDTSKHAVIFNSQNGTTQQDAETLLDQKALKEVYDVGLGEYDVVPSSGPMYKTARKEAFSALTTIVTAKPELFPIVGDIWAKYADWPGANVLGDRLKRMLPPNLQDQEDQDPQTQLTLAQSQLQQLNGQVQQMAAELARASDTIRTTRLQLESKERIAMFQSWAGMIEALLKANVTAGSQAMQVELDTIKDRMLKLHERMSIEQDAGQPPIAPELPGKVEPKPLAVTPQSPVTPVPGSTGPAPNAPLQL